MTDTIERAAQHHIVMDVIRPCPKPTKQRRGKNPRKILERQLEDIIKLLVFWRDGQQCVESVIDGSRCGNGLQWGHFIPRSQSAWLKYELITFCQCGNHNLLHKNGAQTMAAWFSVKFGLLSMQMVDQEARAHVNQRRSTHDLREMLDRYTDLYQNRFYVGLELCDLISAGYYGETIKQAWTLEGRKA